MYPSAVRHRVPYEGRGEGSGSAPPVGSRIENTDRSRLLA